MDHLKFLSNILISALNFIDKNKRLKGEPPEERKILCCSGIKAAVEQVLDTEGCAGGPSRSSP